MPLEDQRRLFDVNYWGVVHGTLVAARHLKGKGGAIVNTGSVLSDRSMALQGPYSASKFAIKGVTEAFRTEFLAEDYRSASRSSSPARSTRPTWSTPAT